MSTTIDTSPATPTKDNIPTPKASNATPKKTPQPPSATTTRPRPTPSTQQQHQQHANNKTLSSSTPRMNSALREEFKNQLVRDVFEKDNRGKVPMEKVAMLIWQFRDDPAVVHFMAQFVAKFSGSRQVFDGIEFYLPQIAHMIIHLEADWDEAILERFALVIAQQSQHFALQLTWILQGAIEDYQPETVEGRPNPGYNQLFYHRCITLLSNIERCVVYGSPRSIELQRMYEKGDISQAEYEQMKLEDRLNNAKQITTHGANFRKMVGAVQRVTDFKLPALKTPTKAAADAENTTTTVVGTSTDNKTGKQISKYGGYLLYKRRFRTACYKRKTWKSRYFEIEERMLYCYNHRPSIGGRLVRAMPLEGAGVQETEGGKYPYMFEVQNQHFEFVMRAKNDNEMKLWMKLLRGESEANALIPHIVSNDEVDGSAEEKKEDRGSPTKTGVSNKLSSSQQARYDFFKNERDFVASVCDVAEVLRFHEPKERKALAPGLAAAVKFPPCAYVPLCKSTDVWRRVDSVMANDTRVFNTNERCPMIYYFVAKRGEKIGAALGPKNPNLDVAEYLNMQFQVPDSDPVGKLMAIGEDEDHEGNVLQTEDSKDEDDVKDEEKEEEDMVDEDSLGSLTMEDPTDSGNGTVWSETTAKGSFLSKSLSSSSRKGNDQLRKFMEENVIKLPSKLALQVNRFESRRKMSYLDRTANTTPGVMTSTLTTTPIIESTIMENPVIENQNDDDSSLGDSVSLDGQSVVSVGGGSIILGDQVVAFQQSDGVDKASLDRAKEVVSGGESWAEKSARMLRSAKNEHKEEEDTSIYEIVTFMAKSNDDLRQEVFVMQMIHYFESVFAKSNIPVWLKTYRILSTSKSTGLIEVLTDATSIDGLKKSEKYPASGGMRAYFEQVYGPPTSKSFLAAQRNFIRSLAGYSLVAYLLGLKDRHNGNIMIDTRGHVIHIDFGFAFGMAPGHEWSFERAPFKLTRDYIDVMGGLTSEGFKEFQKLFVDGFKAARSNSLTALGLVEIMMYKSNYPCFTGTRYGGGVSLKRFEKRLMLDVPDSKVEKKALQLVSSSADSTGTKIYDIFQYHSNGLAV